MNCTVKYKNGNKLVELPLRITENKIVKDYKDDISRRISICSQYIVLTHKNVSLEDDVDLDKYVIFESSVIVMQIEISVVGINDEYHRFLMEYDDRVSDLRKAYCSQVQITDVLLICKDTCRETEYLRTHLNKKHRVFTAFAAITVSIVNKDGAICHIEAYENDTLKTIRAKIIKRDFLDYKKATFMFDDRPLWDSFELFKLRKCDPFVIFVGFTIFVKVKDRPLFDLMVNFGTQISFLTDRVTEKFGRQSNLICVSRGADRLDNDRTVGFYKITDGETLDIVENEIIEEPMKIEGNVSLEKVDNSATIEETIQNTPMDDSFITNDNYFGEPMKIEENALLRIDNNSRINDSSQFNDNSCRRNLIGQPMRNEKEISLQIVNFSVTSDCISRIRVERNCSVLYLTTIISQQLRIGMCSLDIYYIGVVLCGGNLDKYGIEDNDSLVLKTRKHNRNAEEQFIIKVNNGTNTENYLIDEFQTVGGLKNVLRGRHNVNINRIRLFIEGMDVSDDDVIRELDIASGCVVSLIIDDGGGCDGNDNCEDIYIRVRNTVCDNGDMIEGEDEGDGRVIGVNATSTIQTLRDTLRDIFALSATNDFVISYDGEILKNENDLSTYGIVGSGGSNEVIMSASVLIRYFPGVDGSTAKVYRYALLPGDKVSHLKTRIKRTLNIEPRFINLTFNGVSLEDEGLLEDSGVENGSYIMMVATLAGGDR